MSWLSLESYVRSGKWLRLFLRRLKCEVTKVELKNIFHPGRSQIFQKSTGALRNDVVHFAGKGRCEKRYAKCRFVEASMRKGRWVARDWVRDHERLRTVALADEHGDRRGSMIVSAGNKLAHGCLRSAKKLVRIRNCRKERSVAILLQVSFHFCSLAITNGQGRSQKQWQGLFGCDQEQCQMRQGQGQVWQARRHGSCVQGLWRMAVQETL